MTNTLRRILTTLAFITGVCLITPGGGPSVEEMFVATTEAAEETEGAMCLMPDGVDGWSSIRIRASTAWRSTPRTSS
ncbi:MAG: hypothetical protein DMG04_26735 [Acidobacteria bacterium]|nr:MAG: hypothetical protein DMG04_26735 [Acidobacteriota bacterium]